ncbi:sugar nucleotide-binding protein [Pontibacter toksunensis]|uniref:Sugar nucleotide-binding protein n=1 Tax=Pontibacter toksunensis TaxID=1332631 RepID=A0ABW6BNF7_9BACT
MANEGETSWASLASEVAKLSGYNRELVKPVPFKNFGYKATRPVSSVLHSERGLILPSLEDALGRYFREQEIFEPTPPVIASFSSQAYEASAP